MKLKEYLLASSDFSSPGDIDILFEEEPWGRGAAAIWAGARNYFTPHREDVIGITMTMDSPNKFWRAYITQGLESCIYEELSAIGKPSLGLLSIRIHLEEESDSKHRDALRSMNFLEDDHGYWSYNIWSE